MKKGQNQMAIEFEKLGGLEQFDKLQENPNKSIYQTVVSIMNKYWQIDAEGLNTIDLAMPQTGFQFT